MAMALLNAGVDRTQKANCTGAFQLENHTFHCDKRHGLLDMDGAVVHSCDVYFYTMCLRVGADKLSPMVRSMGFGEKFDLPFDNQRYGTIPDPDWMMRKYHRKWQGYDTVNMSIGQGMVLINPLQLATMASRLATGKRVVPRLLKNKPIVPQTQLAVDQDHLDFIRKAMWGVVDHGTAAAAKLPLDGIQMAGKTGTAQTHNLSAGERGDYPAAAGEAAVAADLHRARNRLVRPRRALFRRRRVDAPVGGETGRGVHCLPRHRHCDVVDEGTDHQVDRLPALRGYFGDAGRS